jgi:hypothetical protein
VRNYYCYYYYYLIFFNVRKLQTEYAFFGPMDEEEEVSGYRRR